MAKKIVYINRNRGLQAITHFKGQYEFLSNFFLSYFTLGDKGWRSVEHYYQAMKSPKKSVQEFVRKSKTPGVAKKRGQRVELRDDWDCIKERVMLEALRAKFKQNRMLGERLLNTKPKLLVEGNWWHDNYWGKCDCNRCLKNEKAKNRLGVLLSRVRKELSIEKANSR